MNQIVTQREKTFLPHVLAVPVGTSVQFRNDDRIYHNVFSIAKPNEFDGGIRATGATYVKTFSHPGVVQLLCNIHATMNAYVVVVDSPYYAKAQASGAFKIHNVPPGRYDVSAWHEAGSTITHRTITSRRRRPPRPHPQRRRRQTPRPLRPRQIRPQTPTPTRLLALGGVF